MLYERMLKAKRALQSNMPQESNFEDTYYEGEEKITGRKEEVLVGHNYIDDNSETDNTLGEGYPIADPESPNDLDADTEMEENNDEELDTELATTVTKLSEYSEAMSPAIDEMEESMDRLQEMENRVEDTSGKTDSHVAKFLENYAEGNDIIQVLRKDLMSVLSDMQWIVESNNNNEQWALDFADALNEISTTI